MRNGRRTVGSLKASLAVPPDGEADRTDELHLYNSTDAHGAGACRQGAAATSTARCGTRRSGTPPTALRELHHNPRHTMCEDWPKQALRFMGRLDFACRDVWI